MARGAEREEGVAGAGATLRESAAAYAQLVRLPNLFTAPPDVLLGAALATAAGRHAPAAGQSQFAAASAQAPSAAAIAGLALASATLYAGGTTLNDAFDAPADARDRPSRPIPAGVVARRTAFGLGAALLAVGIAIATLSGGAPSGLVAAALAAAVLAYDGALKETPLGAPAMGAARGLNVVLGASVGALPALGRSAASLAVPVALALYVAAVTSLAADETRRTDRSAVLVAAAGAVVALGALAWYVRSTASSSGAILASVALAAAFAWWIGRPLRRAYADPVPDRIGPAVGACVLGIVLLDAAFAAAVGVTWALAVAAFLVPATTLSRAFDVS